jgi:excisionase family DNA binding protein
MTLSALLTDRDVAALLLVQPDTVRRWAAAGQLPSVRLGGRLLRFRAEDVERWIDEYAHREQPADSLRHRGGSIRSSR